MKVLSMLSSIWCCTRKSWHAAHTLTQLRVVVTIQLICRTIYNMCTQKPPHDFSEQLYNRYRDCFSLYITEKVFVAAAVHHCTTLHWSGYNCWLVYVQCQHQVLPALKDKKDEYLLKELLKRWDNHKIMVRWLSRFFNYLDRCAIWHMFFKTCLSVSRELFPIAHG